MTVREILEARSHLTNFDKIYKKFLALKGERGDHHLWNEFKDFECSIRNSSVEIKFEILDTLDQVFYEHIKNYELDLLCRKILALLKLYLLDN